MLGTPYRLARHVRNGVVAATSKSAPVASPVPLKYPAHPVGIALGDGALHLGCQSIRVANHDISLVSPMDIDAVIDWYIEKGMSAVCKYSATCQLHTGNR